ncbi:MAG: c-type cytochrome biogenesis protein CcmI [Pseudohongiellaceae bacterium]
MFWILTVCLFIVATLFVLVPLWMRRQARSYESAEIRNTANIALFHERANELEAQLATGEIDEQQHQRLTTELEQNLLADIGDADKEAIAQERLASGNSDVAKSKDGRFALTFAVPVVLALLIPLVAYFSYDRWGYFEDVALMDLFERTVNNVDDPEEAQALIVALGGIVRENEELPWAWYFLGENFANIGMFGEAQIAYQRAADLLPESSDKALVLGRVALAMYVNAGLEFSPQIEAVVEQAREINPNEVSVLQLLAANAENNADWEAAIDYWRLLIQQNPNSQGAQELRQNIAAAQQMLARQNPELASSGPVLEVTVRLADELALDDKLRVFVAARNAAREGMPPLAAMDLTVAQLPTTIRLDNSSAVGPFNLGSAETVYISALVSQAGVASPRPGDYRVVSETLDLAAARDEPLAVELTISERVTQ